MNTKAYFKLFFLLLFVNTNCFLFAQQTKGFKLVVEDDNTKEWKEISLYSNIYAVIIGINAYPNLKSDFQLSYAVSDAKAVEKMLKNKFTFSEIYTMYNEQATKSNIMDVLLNKLSKISKDDAVFVFFAGHGGQQKTDYGDIGFIVPYDGDFSDMRNIITMTSIRDDISKRIKAKHVFYVMDACYSGLLLATRDISNHETHRNYAYLQEIAREPVRQVLTAGNANQSVLDDGPYGHSVFTGRFLEILDNSDDFITASEISVYVNEKVFSDANTRGHVQTPKHGKLFGLGDFIFIPSFSKKQESITEQIKQLENELIKNKELEKRAKQFNDKIQKRELERQRNIINAKLETQRLEKQRLEQDRITKLKEEEIKRLKIEEQKKEKEKEEARLLILKKEVEEKRKINRSSMILSLNESLNELQILDDQIQEIKEKYLNELKNKILTIADNYSKNYCCIDLEKDEFETETEYQQRLKNQKDGSNNTLNIDFEQAMTTIETLYNEQVITLLQQMQDISNNNYTIYGHDALNIKLGKYNADKESFKITIASKNITTPIYPQDRFLFIYNVSGQTRKIGIQNGDMVYKYNNIIVKPDVDWSELKQTVLTDYVNMEIVRNGKSIKYTLQKGQIGIDTYVDDYAKDLKPNQVLVNGDLYVPRVKARKFKQNYLNGFITAELKVKSISPLMSLVTKAIVVDESNEIKYDLLKSQYLSIGNRLVIDTKNKIIWLTEYSNTKLNWNGTSKFAKQFQYKGMKNWEIPTYSQIKNIRNSNISIYFNFGDNEFYTKSESKHGGHIPYDPKRDRVASYFEDSKRYKVVLIMPFESDKKSFNLFENRFIPLKTGLVFDTKNKLIWMTNSASNKTFTYLEAEKYIKEMQYKELEGWRLPTIKEFKSLYDEALPGLFKIFNLGDKSFYTKSVKYKGTHFMYPGNPMFSDDNYKVYIIGVM